MKNNLIHSEKGISVGLHILGEVQVNNGKQLRSMAITKSRISKIIKNNGLHELGAFYHRFPEGGFTGIVCLVESHLAIHTWPELNFWRRFYFFIRQPSPFLPNEGLWWFWRLIINL